MEGISHEARVVRRTLQARQADRVLRRQSHHDRRLDRSHLQRRYGEALRGLRLAGAAHRRRQRPRRDRRRDRRSAERRRTSDDGHHADAHRLRQPAPGLREGARRGARQGQRHRHEEEPRLAEPRAVLRSRRGARRTGAARRRRAPSCTPSGTRSTPPTLARIPATPRSSTAGSPASASPNWDAKAPSFTEENGAIASRAAFGAALNATADCLPELVGGSADLTPSNNTSVKAWKNFEPGDYAARYMHFGIREHGMASIMNGMALHGGVIPYGGTFLIFSDYMRPPIRLAAIMNQHVIYVYTHDSIGLGEDGPTHQPIEQLSRAARDSEPDRDSSRRRHRDGRRMARRGRARGRPRSARAHAAKARLHRSRDVRAGRRSGPRRVRARRSGGTAATPRVVLMSSGSEVGLVLRAHQQLAEQGVPTRVVSMPSMELFARQSTDYQTAVLPSGIPRVSIEAAHPMSWYRWVGAGRRRPWTRPASARARRTSGSTRSSGSRCRKWSTWRNSHCNRRSTDGAGSTAWRTRLQTSAGGGAE